MIPVERREEIAWRTEELVSEMRLEELRNARQLRGTSVDDIIKTDPSARHDTRCGCSDGVNSNQM